MAFYKKMYNKKTEVYYPISVTVGRPVETKEIAEHLAQISTVSKSDVAAVLGDLAQVMSDYLRQGKSVRLDGLGTFRLTLDTEGVKDEKDFDFNRQLKAVRVQFTPQRSGATTRGEAVTRTLVPQGIEWLPVDYVPATAEPSTPDEPGTGGSGEGGDGTLD